MDQLLYVPPALLLATFLFIHVAALRSVALAMTALVVAWVWRRHGVPPIPLKIPLALWAALALLSVTWAINPAYSLAEFRVEVIYDIAIFAGFFALTREPWQWNLFRGALLAGLAVMSVMALLLYFRTRDLNADSALGGMLSISTHVVTLLPLLLAGIWEFRGRPAVWVPVAAIGLVSLAMGYYTLNRNFLPSVDVVAVALAVMLTRRGMGNRWLVGAAAAAVVAVSVPLFLSVAKDRADKIETTVGSSLAGDPRLGIWKFSATLIRENPLTGAGFGRFAAAEAYRKQYPDEVTNAHAHNPFLNYAVQMGLCGAAVLAMLLVALLMQFWKLAKSDQSDIGWIGISGIAMVLGVLVKTQTDDIWGRQHGYLFWALTGMMLGYAHCRKESAVSSGDTPGAA